VDSEDKRISFTLNKIGLSGPPKLRRDPPAGTPEPGHGRGWLSMRGIEPAGAPFLKYNIIDMGRQLEIEAGVPVAAVVGGEGPVFAGVLPAGRYATVTHVGHPAKLVDVTTALLNWAAEQGLAWDMSENAEGDRWGCRLEVYNTNPAEEPDPDKWRRTCTSGLPTSITTVACDLGVVVAGSGLAWPGVGGGGANATRLWRAGGRGVGRYRWPTADGSR
jgi:hypothetical protein